MTQIGSYFVCFCGDISDFNFMHSVERRMDCHMISWNCSTTQGLISSSIYTIQYTLYILNS